MLVFIKKHTFCIMTELESNQPASEAVSQMSEPKRSGGAKYFIAIIIVVLIVLGVLYFLEKEGRSSTNIFGALLEQQYASAAVAMVNGESITNKDLTAGIRQFSQVAAAQGADTEDPTVQASIRSQALEIMVNTELLLQAAAAQGIVVTDEEVVTRLSELVAQIGGEEAMHERMAALGVDEERLHRDVRNEIVISQLLDGLFADKDLTVTDEEVQETYDLASEGSVSVPPLEEVRAQIEAQLSAAKEQEIIDEYLSTLKETAEVEIVAG